MPLKHDEDAAWMCFLIWGGRMGGTCMLYQEECVFSMVWDELWHPKMGIKEGRMFLILAQFYVVSCIGTEYQLLGKATFDCPGKWRTWSKVEILDCQHFKKSGVFEWKVEQEEEWTDPNQETSKEKI